MSDSDEKTAAADSTPAATHVEPPRIYLAACGALCDVFWWARRDPPAEPPLLPPVKDETP